MKVREKNVMRMVVHMKSARCGDDPRWSGYDDPWSILGFGVMTMKKRKRKRKLWTCTSGEKEKNV